MLVLVLVLVDVVELDEELDELGSGGSVALELQAARAVSATKQSERIAHCCVRKVASSRRRRIDVVDLEPAMRP